VKSNRGYTLIEAVVSLGIAAVVMGLLMSVQSHVSRDKNGLMHVVYADILLQSLEQSIQIGMLRHFDASQQRFYVDFEGVRVVATLPSVAHKTYLPSINNGSEGLTFGVYPVGTVIKVPQRMVVGDELLGANDNQTTFTVTLPVDETLHTAMAEDANNDCLLNPGEDSNNNRLLDSTDSNCSAGVIDGSEALAGNEWQFTDNNSNGQFDSPPIRAYPINPYALNPNVLARQDHLRQYGYQIKIENPGFDEPYQVTLYLYDDIFAARAIFQWGNVQSYDELVAFSTPELNIAATNGLDDDGDGQMDLCDRVFLLANGPDPACNNQANRFGSAAVAETEVNGIDDDRDGVIDDGLFTPVRQWQFDLAKQ